MAYCNKCGAYIPDGQTKCLACGYDEAAEQTSSQYAYAYNKETAQRDYEAERAEMREKNRQWAKEEYARREQQKAEDRARKAEEKAKKTKAETEARRAEQQAEYHESYSSTRRSSSGLTYTEGNSKIFAALSYVSLGFLLQKLFLPGDSYAEFHAKQGQAHFVVGLLAQIVLSFFDLGWVVFLFRVGFTIRGIINAKSGKRIPLPIVNDIIKRFK